MNKLPPCTCGAGVEDGRVCPMCHQGMDIPKSYFPELAKSLDGLPMTGSVFQKAQDLTLPNLADKYLPKDAK